MSWSVLAYSSAKANRAAMAAEAVRFGFSPSDPVLDLTVTGLVVDVTDAAVARITAAAVKVAA